jgi:hypothetical protein
MICDEVPLGHGKDDFLKATKVRGKLNWQSTLLKAITIKMGAKHVPKYHDSVIGSRRNILQYGNLYQALTTTVNPANYSEWTDQTPLPPA